jgi:glycosyltransferase involved in cell wall biosynthesis
MSVLAIELNAKGWPLTYVSLKADFAKPIRQIELGMDLVSKILTAAKYRLPAGNRHRLSEIITRKEVKKLYEACGSNAIFLTCSFRQARELLELVEPERIVFWMHSPPRLEDFRDFSELVRQKINLVTPSNALYQWVWRSFQTSSIGVFHYHIPNFYSVEPPTSSDAQIDFGLPSDRPIIFHGGGDGINKGKHLVERVARLVGKKKPVCLVTIGNNPRREEVGEVLRIELERMPPDKLASLISLSDICLMPSLWFENAPLLLLEYRVANRKVVASRSGGIEEYADVEKTWFVENPNNVDEWIERIEDALQSENPPASNLQTQKIISKTEWMEKWESLFQQIEARD